MPLLDGFQLVNNFIQGPRIKNVRVCFMTSGEINMNGAREVHPLREYTLPYQEANYFRTVVRIVLKRRPE